MNMTAYRKPAALSTLLRSPAATLSLGRRILKDWPTVHVWLLQGQLGAGKTTLVRGMLRSLGVRQAVTSPTFGLAQHYRLHRQPWQRVIHIDGYRVRGQHEYAALEIDEAVADQLTLLIVEWPERLPGVAWGRHGAVRLRRFGQARRASLRLRAR